MVCGRLSSYSSKSSLVRPRTRLPSRSVTTKSTLTTWTSMVSTSFLCPRAFAASSSAAAMIDLRMLEPGRHLLRHGAQLLDWHHRRAALRLDLDRRDGRPLQYGARS